MKYFILLILSMTAAEASLNGYCFDQKINLDQVRSSIEAIRHPKDKIFKRPSLNCLEIEGSASRGQLYETFLNRKFRLKRTYGEAFKSLSDSNQSQCNLNIKRTSKRKSKTKSFSLGRKNNLLQKMNSSEKITNSQLLIDSGKSGTLRIDQFRVEILCTKQGPRYQLRIQLSHSRGGVHTSITVLPGEEIDLGSIVDDLNSKSKSVSISDGISRSKTRGKVSSKYTISVN